jgi:L-lactate dehydrogenase
MALVAYRNAGLPAGQVIGTGTLLDSSRLRQRLAERVKVAPGSIDGDVLGEHGDSEVAAFSTVRIGGLTLEQFTGPDLLPERTHLAEAVRQDGYRIVAGKGYTSFGIATATVRICEAVLRDEKSVLPVSALTNGQFGIKGIFLSLPCVLGAAGIERILTPDLTAGERSEFAASAEVLAKALVALDGAN